MSASVELFLVQFIGESGDGTPYITVVPSEEDALNVVTCKVIEELDKKGEWVAAYILKKVFETSPEVAHEVVGSLDTEKCYIWFDSSVERRVIDVDLLTTPRRSGGEDAGADEVDGVVEAAA